MTQMSNSGSFLRRGQDLPILLVSLDYELFFQQSGSIEKCLFEPSDLFSKYARSKELKATFFVDAGMLCRMDSLSAQSPSLSNDLRRIKEHIERLADEGHEIGLHIHPHWEDTRLVDGQWEFGSTRYQLRDFSDAEVVDIVSRYTTVLNELCDGKVRAFRAGGFCVEPFGVLGRALEEQGITVDSSVVPGLRIRDDEKGVDFRSVPRESWWRFTDSPLSPMGKGRFLEVPITPQVLPAFHYWGRAVSRVLGATPADSVGDGSAKAIGHKEIIRRLTGRGRTSELSIDAPKADRLNANRTLQQDRSVWHVMGHPKLLGKTSIEELEKFSNRKNISRFETVSGLADAIRTHEQQTGVNQGHS